jgi:hypothetical protein
LVDYLSEYRDALDVMEYQILATTAGNPATPDTPGALRPAIYGVGANTLPASATATSGRATAKFISYSSNVLAYDKWRGSASGQNRKPRGTLVIKRISTAEKYATVADIANTTIPAVNSRIVYVDVQVTEPLLMSPFIFGNPSEKQAMYGITNTNFFNEYGFSQ